VNVADLMDLVDSLFAQFLVIAFLAVAASPFALVWWLRRAHYRRIAVHRERNARWAARYVDVEEKRKAGIRHGA
jgi:hypothetical protein